MSDFVSKQVEALVNRAEPALSGVSREDLLGSMLVKTVEILAPKDSAAEVPNLILLRLCLLNDCLRIAERALLADGVVSDSEVSYIFPLLRRISPLLGLLRQEYAGYDRLAPSQGRELLLLHTADALPFGGANAETEWVGFQACQNMVRLTHDASLRRGYEQLMGRLIDGVAARGGRSLTEERVAQELRELVRGQIGESDEEGGYYSEEEARVQAFCSADSRDVFHAVAHANEIWESDPFDVDSVHVEARQAFDYALDQVHGPSSKYGRSLLLLGESGAGKTHLLRAFRAMAHGSWRAYSGYIQLNIRTGDYIKFVVRRLIDSMDRPYDPPRVTDSGLAVLSDALVSRIIDGNLDRIQRLRDGELTVEELGYLTHDLANRAYNSGLHEVHVDLLRAFLLLQRRDPALRQRILKFLRCEPLSTYEQQMLGEISAWTDDTAPNRMLVGLGKLAWEADGTALVLLFDQLEDLAQQGDPAQKFRAVADTIRSITDELPHCLVVLASLENFMEAYGKELTKPVRDRLERDPEPVRLTSERHIEEIHELVNRRLAVLYGDFGLEPDEERPLFPFTSEVLLRARNLRTRDVVDLCATYHRRCKEAGRLVGHEGATPQPVSPLSGPVAKLSEAFAQARLQEPAAVPEADGDLVDLVGWGVERLAEELGRASTVEAKGEQERLIRFGEDERVYVALSNKMPQGGHLGRQLEAMAKAAKSKQARLVLVRSGEFPQRAGTQVAELLGQLIKAGARKVVLADEDVRELARLREFWKQRQELLPSKELVQWLHHGRVLQRMAVYQDMFGLEGVTVSGNNSFSTPPRPKLQESEPIAPTPAVQRPTVQRPTVGGGQSEPVQTSFAVLSEPAVEAPEGAGPGPIPPPEVLGQSRLDKPAGKVTPVEPVTAVSPGGAAEDASVLPAVPAGSLHLGHGMGLRAPKVSLPLSSLTKHAAIVGSTGSGKTTLALAMIEQLLSQGVPVVMLDRKGDLCTYGDPAFWATPEEDSVRNAQKQALAARLDVRIFTPGDDRGQPLVLPLVPNGMANLPASVRGPAATHAATALGAMLSIKPQPHDQKLSILAKSIELLVDAQREVTLETLMALVRERDPDLMNAVGAFDDKHFDVLAERLLGLTMLNRQLFSQHGEKLDASMLLGKGAFEVSGRTRLSIVSTKALHADEAIEFWVAQLLTEMLTWASRNPNPSLQGVIFLDEADIYLPATRKPPTKEPVLDLLKRGRSAGLGVMLATQNPGDFDYKARANLNAWFLGRVSQVNDLKRMKPLLSEARSDVSGKLANAERGEFYLLEAGQVQPFQANRSLMETRQMGDQEILELARRNDQKEAREEPE